MTSRLLPISAVACAMALATGVLVAAEDKDAAPRDPATPPPMLLELTVDGQTHSVAVDTPTTLAINGKDVVISLAAKPYRELTAAGATLQYPQHMAYEYEPGDGATTYTMDGNNAVLMLQHYHEEIDPIDAVNFYVEGVSGIFGRANTQVGDATLQLMGKQIKGKRIVLAGNLIVQDIFAVSGPEGTLGIMIQDTPDEAGQVTAETKAMTQMLSESFRVVD